MPLYKLGKCLPLVSGLASKALARFQLFGGCPCALGALAQSTIAISVREVALVLEYCYGKLDGLIVPQQSPSQGSSSDQALLKEDP